MFYAPKGLRVVSKVELSQESESGRLVKIRLDSFSQWAHKVGHPQIKIFAILRHRHISIFIMSVVSDHIAAQIHTNVVPYEPVLLTDSLGMHDFH